MEGLVPVSLECHCGGSLTISDIPEGMGQEVATLIDYFHFVHDDHGLSGVREPRVVPPNILSDGGTA